MASWSRSTSPKTDRSTAPKQIEARIDNDQDISAWFTLRCSEGSACIRGNLLVIPIGDSLLFVEPVYIRAEGVDFPELKRVILATANQVVMEDSLGLALAELTGARSLAEVGQQPEAARAGAPATTTAPGDDVGQQINILSETIGGIKDDIASLEEAVERLKQLTGSE